MGKKFISYLVIYSLLYSNAVFAGNGIGGIKPPENERTPITIRQKPLPSQRPPLQRPQDLSLINVAINEPTSPASSKKQRKKLDIPQIPQSSTAKRSSLQTTSLLNASPLEALGTTEENKSSRSPNSSESGDTKSLTKTSSSENLFPETSSSPASSSPEHLGPIQAIDLNRPGSQQEDLNIPPLEVFRTATPTETSALLEKTSHLFSVPKKPKKGVELRDSESDSDGIHLRGHSSSFPQETVLLKQPREQGESKPSDDVTRDGLQEVTEDPLQGPRPSKGAQTHIEDLKGIEPTESVTVALTLVKNSAHIGLEGGEDPEGNGASLLSNEDIDNLPPAAKAFLLHSNYLIEGKPTWRQILIGSLGIPIGIGVGNAMPPIFAVSLDGLGKSYLNIIEHNNTVANLFIVHTAITLGIDSILRNMHILGKLAGPSLEEFSATKSKNIKNARRVFLVLTYGIAAIAALLPVYYLWNAEEPRIKKYPNDKQFIAFFGSLAPTLWLDSLLVISRAVKNWMDEEIDDFCITQAYSNRLADYTLQQKELARFKDLAQLFSEMNDEEIEKAYAVVYTNQRHTTESDASFSDEQHNKVLEALHTLRALRKLVPNPIIDAEIIKQDLENGRLSKSSLLGLLKRISPNIENNAEIIKQYLKNGQPSTPTLLTYGIPLIASVGRSAVFWYVIDDLLNSLGMPLGATRSALSISLGELLASAFQGKLEFDTVKKAVSDLLFTSEEKESSHNPWWKTARILGKGYTYLQGAWNTLPYMLVGGKTTRFWPTWTRIITLLPFGGVEMFKKTVIFQESYGDVIGTVESVAAHYGKMTPGYMRKTLIGLTKKCYDLYYNIHADVVDPLEKILSVNNIAINNPEDIDFMSSKLSPLFQRK